MGKASYFRGVNGVLVVNGNKNLVFLIIFGWLLEDVGVIYVCRWNFVAVEILQCAIGRKFKCEIIVIDNNYSLVLCFIA